MFVKVKDTATDKERWIHADEARDFLGIVDPFAVVDAQAQARVERYNVGRWHYGPVAESGTFATATKHYFGASGTGSLTTDIKGRVGRYDEGEDRFKFHCDQDGVYNVKPYFSFELADSPAENHQLVDVRLYVDHYDRSFTLKKSVEVGRIRGQRMVIVGGPAGGQYQTWVSGGGMGSPDEIDMECDDFLVMYWVWTGTGTSITLFEDYYMRLAVNRVNDYELTKDCCDD